MSAEASPVEGDSCALPAPSPRVKPLSREHAWTGPNAQKRLKILQNATVVAIVGASPNSARASYFVATYLLQSSSYRVYFVNPHATEILGQKTYPTLAALPEVPDIVDVFRRSSEIPAVVEDVLAIGAPTLWLQLGVINEEAAVYAESQGLTVVMDRCLKIEHARFNGGLYLLGFNTGVISARKTAR